MKKRKINAVIGAFFALAMAISVGTTLSMARVNKHPEIVLAEEDPETPVSSEDDTPQATAEGGSATNESQESASSSQSSSSSSSSSTLKSVIKLFLKIFRDALRDLRDHVKRWLSFFKK